MQVFLVSDKITETAKSLDPKRLNKQILECDWILDAFNKNTRAKNHPIAKMYKDDLNFVLAYKECLKYYRDNKSFNTSQIDYDKLGLENLPKFLKGTIAQAYFENFKRRLYTKDPNYYKDYAIYGTTNENWYYLNGTWYIYNGGRIGEMACDNDEIIKRYY